MPTSSASNPTPGEIAYTTYWRACTPEEERDLALITVRPWAQVHPQNQAAWEAAAQAVREDYKQALSRPWQEGQTRRWVPQPLHTEQEPDDA